MGFTAEDMTDKGRLSKTDGIVNADRITPIKIVITQLLITIIIYTLPRILPLYSQYIYRRTEIGSSVSNIKRLKLIFSLIASAVL